MTGITLLSTVATRFVAADNVAPSKLYSLLMTTFLPALPGCVQLYTTVFGKYPVTQPSSWPQPPTCSTQARRTKEMLSANTEAPFVVEELLDGQDFRSSIKRQQLEDLAGDFFQRAAKPLQRLLQRNGLAPTDIHAVELLGGGSRIPKLQAQLGHVLSGRVLDKYVVAVAAPLDLSSA